MSLIECLECGKNVSEYANNCPNCGYNIQQYVIKKKKENNRSQRILELEKNIEIPSEPKKPEEIDIKKNKWLSYFAWLLLVVGIWGAFFSYRMFDFFMDISVIMISFLVCFASIYILYYTSNREKQYFREMRKYDVKLKEYNSAINNPAEYKRKKAETICKMEESINAIKQNHASNTLKCPYCESTKVTKISTVNRMVSTSMVGIASKKIGKQWHCNNCGSDF